MPHPMFQPKEQKPPTAYEPPTPRPATPLPPLPGTPPARPRRRRRRWPLVLLLLLVAAAPFAASAGVAALYAGDARAAVDRAQVAVEALDFAGARAALADGRVALGKADVAFAPWKLTTRVPWIGPQVRAVATTLSAGLETAAALETALELVEEIVALVGQAQALGPAPAPGTLAPPTESLRTLTREQKRAILAKLLEGADAAEGIAARLDAAERALAGIDETTVTPSLLAAIAPLKAKIAGITRTFQPLSPLLRVLPRVLGYPTPKTYLFFLANNTELRPSAGFFGSYGIVTLADGEIESLVSDDVYNLDFAAADAARRPAPAPIQAYLGLKKWYLRDANWSPDYAVSALTALSLYDEEAAAAHLPSPRFDGVITVTPDVAEDLLRITGPVTVDGVTFTPETLVERLEYQVELAYLETGKPKEERKEILAHLLQEVVRRLTALPAARWPEAVRVVEEALRRKHVLFYEDDPELQRAFEANGWAGRIADAPGDSLLVVDANLGALKTDAVMERNVRYILEPAADGRFRATASVTYRNAGSFTPFTTRYRTYTRFYVPEGSTLLSSSGHLAGDKLANPKRLPGTVDVSAELGRTVFGMFTSIEPGETRTLSVTYLLPERVSEEVLRGGYRLLVQKQSGAKDYPLTLDLRFGKKLGRAAPAEERTEWGDDRYRLATDLAEDRSFEIGF